MTELLVEIYKRIAEYLREHLNIQYFVAECTSTAPLKFKADRRIILENECLFTENSRKVSIEIETYKMTPDEVHFTGCRGHRADTDGIGTGDDTVIKSVREVKTFVLQEPIEVGDRCVFNKLNNQYIYVGKQVNPHRELIIREVEK